MAISRLNQTTLQNGFEKYNQLWDGRSAVGSMEAISSITLSAAQSSVEFNNIPGTYSHLQIRFFARDDFNAVAETNLGFRFNGDSGANYTRHYIFGNGTTASSGANTGVTQAYSIAAYGSTTYPNVFGAGIFDILDYSNTNKNKTTRALAGVEFNVSGAGIQFTSGLWLNTAAITSINIRSLNGSLVANSSFTLYGIK